MVRLAFLCRIPPMGCGILPVGALFALWAMAMPLFGQPAAVDGGGAVDARRIQAAVSNRERLLGQLARLAEQADAYDPQFGELSLQLATAYNALGRTDEALQAYRRALHLLRINHGLDSVRQLPVLEAMYAINSENIRTAGARQNLEAMLRVHRQNERATDADLGEILERIGRWHLAAYHFEVDKDGLAHLVAANSALTEALEMASSGYDYPLHRALSMVNYSLSRAAGEESVRETDQNKALALEGLITQSYRRGKERLRQGLERARATGDIEQQVRATLLYGDWEQLFDRRQAARQLYFQAWNLAENLNENNLLRLSFDNPHQLPDFRIDEYGFVDPATATVPVAATFDVSPAGVSRNVFIAPDASANKLARRTALRTIRSATYRPAIVDGRLVERVGVQQVVIVNL